MSSRLAKTRNNKLVFYDILSLRLSPGPMRRLATRAAGTIDNQCPDSADRIGHEVGQAACGHTKIPISAGLSASLFFFESDCGRGERRG